MLSQKLINALENRRSRKVILFTLNTDGVDPGDPRFHLARNGSSNTYATQPGVTLTDPDTSRVIEVAPWVLSWPTISKKINVLERRAEIAQTDIQLLADSNLTVALERGAQIATYRLDLWSDGLGLGDVYPLMAGRVIDPPNRPRRGSGISLSLLDGDPLLDRPVLGQFSRDDFPDAPDEVIGTDRTLQIGPVQYRSIAVPIDKDGFWFYCFDGAASDDIVQVEKGGAAIPRGEWTQEIVTVGTLTYTAIKLNTAVNNVAPGVMDVISFTGGAGQIIRENAIEQLLWLSGYRLSDRAIAFARSVTRDFPLEIISNEASVTAITLLTDRILPQTNCVLTLSNGVVDIIPIEPGGYDPIPMTLGDNLLYRIPLDESETPIQEVYSQIEVKCGRDQFGSSSGSSKPLLTVRRSPTFGPAKISGLLSRAKAITGLDRTLSLDANDLIVDLDQNFQPTKCLAAERLADVYAKVHSSTHQRHAYKSNWVDGLYATRGERRSLTDSDEGLDAVPCVVVEQLIPDQNGPILTFQTEDV